jgi:hypothetical protein
MKNYPPTPGKMFKPLLLGIVTVIIVLVACHKTELHLPESASKEKVETFATDYFKAKFEILVASNNVDKSVQAYKSLTLNNDFTRDEISYLLELRSHHVTPETAITSTDVKTTVDSIHRSSFNTIEASITEDVSWVTNTISSYSGQHIVTEMQNKYRIKIQVGAGDWKVIDESEILPTVSDAELEKSLSPQLNNVSTSATTVKTRKYSGKVAAEFAVRFALKDVNCSLYYYGRDCTNFMSQCLTAGGWVEDNDWYSSPVCIRASYAWGGADPLRRYANSSNRISGVSATTSNAALGDVISVEWDGDKSYDHNTMVTDVYKSDIYLSYHSTNTKNILYKDFRTKVVKDRKREPTIQLLRMASSFTYK